MTYPVEIPRPDTLVVVRTEFAGHEQEQYGPSGPVELLQLGTRFGGNVSVRSGLDKRQLRADAAVVGVGTVLSPDWLWHTGLDLADGVLCGPTTHVTDADGFAIDGIVAAGDVARWPNLRFDDTPRRVEHWIDAIEMGRHAADALEQQHRSHHQPTPLRSPSGTWGRGLFRRDWLTIAAYAKVNKAQSATLVMWFTLKMGMTLTGGHPPRCLLAASTAIRTY
ncbi:hypothetical protein ACWCRD_41960 [Streptomyces sp. NPDC002092]